VSEIKFSLSGTALADTGDTNCGEVLDGAIEFAGAASDAGTGIDDGDRQFNCLAVAGGKLLFLVENGLGGDWTDLLADEAGFAVGPRQAAISVNGGGSYFGKTQFVFLLDGDHANGMGGTDLGTECAVVIAISGSHIENRCPEPFWIGFEFCGLNDIGRTDFHALAAADASSEKILLWKRTWRTNSFFIASTEDIFEVSQCAQRCECNDAGKDKISASKWQSLRDVLRGFTANGWGCGFELNRPDWADVDTIHAHETLGGQ